MGALSTIRVAAGRALAALGKGLSSVPSHMGSWAPLILEPFTGAWQRNIELRNTEVTSFYAVFACVTRIASDVAKLRPRLMAHVGKIWVEDVAASPFWQVLRKPNRYQTWGLFFEYWVLSKLLHGNAYALKVRDARGLVVQLYLLNPMLVRVCVAPDGAVIYQLGSDELNGLPNGATGVPASEIIHDRMNCLFHPLVGLSPIYACARAATQGLNIQDNSVAFFHNMSRPSGVLTAPAQIKDETAARLKREWNEKYTGDNSGKVAVLGDGLKYESISMKAVDAQLVEQLKMTGEQVCSVFHVPAWKVGVAPMPAYQNAAIANQVYYSDCLQSQLEAIERALDDGLSLPSDKRVEFDLEDLLRMDAGAMMTMTAEGVKTGVFSPDEARAKFNLSPVTGGATPYLQQQNFSLAALARRDALPDPFATAPPPAPPPAPASPDPDEEDEEELDDEVVASIMAQFRKGLQCETN